MKRTLKFAAITITVVLVVVLAFAAVIANTFLNRQAITDGAEVNGIRIVKDGIVSMAVVPLDNGKVALIDAGVDKSGKAILAELSRRNLQPDAVSAVFLTHGHTDHTAALALFPMAQVMALESEVPIAEGTAQSSGPLLRFMKASPTGIKIGRPLHDGETVNLGRTAVQVFALPGHTQGSAAYLVDGVLFLGDAADATRDGKLKGAPWIFSDSQAQDKASLISLDQRLIKDGSDVKAIDFAHSGVLTQGLTPLTDFAQKNQ